MIFLNAIKPQGSHAKGMLPGGAKLWERITYQLINSNYFNSAYFGRGLGQVFVDGVDDLADHRQEIRARAIGLHFCHFIYFMVRLM